MPRSFWKLATVALGMLVLAPTSAGADTYSVFSCRDPLGAANPASGWAGSHTGEGVVTNNCMSGGGLAAVLPSPTPAGDASGTWQFEAPAGTRIVRVTAKRTTVGLKKSTQTFDLAYALETNFGLPGTSTLETCAPSTDSSCVTDLTGLVDKQGLNGGTLSFRALCTNSGGVCSGSLAVNVAQVNVGLLDPQAPSIANTRLLDDGDTSGTLAVGFDAADIGSGVYRSIVKVDGKPAQTSPFAPAPCADLSPADSDPYQFNVPAPCPRIATMARAAVEAGSLPPGPHGVEIAVEDAAGNETTVYGPVEFPRLNAIAGSSAADALTGRLRMWFVKARNRGRSYTNRYGTRVVTRGILRTRRGRGIQGARIDVYHIRNGKRRLLKTGLKSRAGGKVTLILPLDVDTRTIEYAYRAVRPGKITSRQRLHLKVLRKGKVFRRR